MIRMVVVARNGVFGLFCGFKQSLILFFAVLQSFEGLLTMVMLCFLNAPFAMDIPSTKL